MQKDIGNITLMEQYKKETLPMKKTLILTTGSLVGGLICIHYGYKILNQEKISIIYFILFGLLGSILSWNILNILLKKLN